MANRLPRKCVVTVLLVLLALVPTSLSYAQNLEGKEAKIQKFIELAEKAMDKTETLINITYANQTAMDTIEAEGLLEAFEANVTLFNKAAQNVTNAQERLDAGDLDGAIGNVTFALEAFRDVFRAIHVILRDSGLAKGELLDAQGLIQAMKRALERIEKLREIGDLPVEVEWLLGNATVYLNIPVAIEWLQQGFVNQTAHNLTAANKLIAEAHKALKDVAKEMNTNRIRAHIRVMTKFSERLYRQLDKINDKEQVEAALSEAEGHIADAEYFLGNGEYSSALGSLEDAKDDLNLAEQRLKEQRRAEKATGKGKGEP